MSAQFQDFTITIDTTTGKGEVRRGRSVAQATWDGFTLECPEIPNAARFELEIALMCV